MHILSKFLERAHNLTSYFKLPVRFSYKRADCDLQIDESFHNTKEASKCDSKSDKMWKTWFLNPVRFYRRKQRSEVEINFHDYDSAAACATGGKRYHPFATSHFVVI